MAATHDNTPKHKHAALAQATDTLNAITAANGDTTDDSADANSALAAKIAGTDTATTAAADTTSNKYASAVADAASHKDASAKAATFAKVKESLKAGTALKGDTSDNSADAIGALAAKIAGIAPSANAGTNSAATTQLPSTAQLSGQDNSKQAGAASTAAQSGGKHGDIHTNAKHAKLTAATQAKLVSVLTQAATAPDKIVGSDGKTAASADSKGTPADAQAQQKSQTPGQTPTDTADILAAMQAAQPVVTTVATNADKTKATVTPRTMTQLEKAALGNTAQQTLHSAAPAAKTETQALTMPADAKTADTKDNNSGAQTGLDQKQSHDSGNAHAADDAKTSNAPSQPATVPDAPQPNASTAPVTQTVSTTAVSNAASSIADGSTAQNGTVPPTTVATTLQVAQHSASSSNIPPDLAALAVSIAAKSKNGQNEFNIRMDPADLGRVDVRLSVDASGKAQAHLTVEKPQTLELLQRDSHTLQSSLKDAGLDLSNNGLNFSLKGEQQNSTPTFIARNRALSIASVQTTDSISSTSSTSTAPGDSRLDIRV